MSKALDYRNNLVVELVKRANKVLDDSEKYTNELCLNPTEAIVEELKNASDYNKSLFGIAFVRGIDLPVDEAVEALIEALNETVEGPF